MKKKGSKKDTFVIKKEQFNQGSVFGCLKNVSRRQDRRTLNARYRRKMDRYIGRRGRQFYQERFAFDCHLLLIASLSVWKILFCTCSVKISFLQEVDLLHSGFRLSPSQSWFVLLSLYLPYMSIIIWCKIQIQMKDCQDINVKAITQKAPPQQTDKRNLNDRNFLLNPGGGLLIVYNNQQEEHRFVQPFVVIGRV